MAGSMKGTSGVLFMFYVLIQVCQKIHQAEKLHFVHFALCIVINAF